MKTSGNYFLVYRSLFKSPLWNSEKFTKGQAWVDLFGRANHSDGWFEKNGQRIEIKRGQTGRSIEKLAEDWQWSRNKVKRFLKRLENEQKIERKMDHPMNHLTTIITICNYEEHQFPLTDDEPPDEPPNGLPDEPPDEPQTKKKERKSKKGVKNIPKPENVSDQTWNDFLAHRKDKKATISQTVINTFTKEAEKAGMSLEDVLKECMNRGWRGFKAEWMENKSAKQGQNPKIF